MSGRKIPVTTKIKKISDEVTSVRRQLQVKATMIAAMIVEMASTKTPGFSEMPSCSTLAVLVIVPVASTRGHGIESMNALPEEALEVVQSDG